MKLMMNGQEHEFNFGIGFLRTLDQKYLLPLRNENGCGSGNDNALSFWLMTL